MASTATSPGPYIARFDGAALLAGYRSGALSPVDVATDVIADITERNPTINAFSSFEPGEVLAAARASEERWRRGEPLGPIDGVPCTVKENLNRAGLPARSGSAATSPHTPTRSSPVVERILEAGGVILGSTTMPDWGMLTSGVSSLHGITRSPLDPALTTGGSSSGAAASAAAGFGCFHIGTDIGGSIRLPASFLGLAALKPSDGRVPLDTPFQGRAAGPLAQSISDVSLAMAVISRPDERDYTALPPEEIRWGDLSMGSASDLRGSRVALQLDAGAGIPVDPEVAAAVTAAAQVFADAGAEVVELDPFITEKTLEDVDIFWRVRFWRTYTELSTAAKARVLPFITEWVRRGAEVTGSRVLESVEAINELRRRTVEVTLPFDVVLSPVSPVAAFPAEWPMPWGHEDRGMPHIGFTVPYNMSGQPAASINCGSMADGRAIGLQVSGRRFADREVLRFAAWYEANRPLSAVPLFAKPVSSKRVFARPEPPL